MSEELGEPQFNFVDQIDTQAEGGSNARATSISDRSRVIRPGPDNVVVLPAGAQIAQLEADGRDLVIVLEDGSRIVIPDGAIVVPQIIADNVPVPPANIAALLLGNEPEPAAGPTQISGGNFARDPGQIQSAFDLGDLLPYTELTRDVQEQVEIIPGLIDEEPDIVIETPDNPVGVDNAIATVREDGLPARSDPAEPEGTDAASDGETTSGTIIFSSPDGLQAILINGVEITAVGQEFVSPFGTLTITSINLDTGAIGFSYTLEDNSLGISADGTYVATVIDRDGDQASASVQINIVDDGPEGVDDAASVPGGTFAAITGNVLDNDISGADDFPVGGGVTGFSNASGSADPGTALQGTYGVLTLYADGSYTYVRDFNTPGGVEESFDYEIVDQDDSVSSARLTITIGNAEDTIDIPDIGEGTEVRESHLPPTTASRDDEAPGSAFDGNSESTAGTITFFSPDGVESVTVEGVTIDPGNLPQTIVSDATGSLVITGYSYDPQTGQGTIGYTYTLNDNTSGDDTSASFDVVVTDLDGDAAADTLVIDIIDDEPIARGSAGDLRRQHLR